jgi:hypothetical protein
MSGGNAVVCANVPASSVSNRRDAGLRAQKSPSGEAGALPAQNGWKGANQTSRPGSWAMARVKSAGSESPAKNWPHQNERGQKRLGHNHPLQRGKSGIASVGEMAASAFVAIIALN